MTQDPDWDGSTELLCVVSLKTDHDEISDDEAEVLRNDWVFFLEPYLTEFVVRPNISKQNKQIFTTSFQCKEYMKEIVENFIDITMKYHDDYTINIAFDSIDRRL